MSDVRVEGEGLSRLIGIEYLEFGDGHARAQLEVTPQVMQPFGVLHGGALAALAESLCSRATYQEVAADGMTALGMSNLTTFLRPIPAGHVHADATARHRGRTTWVWDCEMSDDEGRVCALSRLTIAVRPQPSS